MYKHVIIFLILNFGALAIASLFTSNGVASNWYQNLNKAPWTPPGWMFGLAWTTIMICFTLYMAYALNLVEVPRTLIILFAMQWLLNSLWSPVFFYYHQVLWGLLILIALTGIVTYFLFNYGHNLGIKSILILPYFLWLIVATSLNLYTYLYN